MRASRKSSRSSFVPASSCSTASTRSMGLSCVIRAQSAAMPAVSAAGSSASAEDPAAAVAGASAPSPPLRKVRLNICTSWHSLSKYRCCLEEKSCRFALTMRNILAPILSVASAVNLAWVAMSKTVFGGTFPSWHFWSALDSHFRRCSGFIAKTCARSVSSGGSFFSTFSTFLRRETTSAGSRRFSGLASSGTPMAGNQDQASGRPRRLRRRPPPGPRPLRRKLPSACGVPPARERGGGGGGPPLLGPIA
mmetsp:Transcript_131759/g.409588  ORF Transcript_131759/g.409588 Transcript_131759/m.409588 type:complete len:250 (-) Transcript_131759:4-753(-)